MRANLSKTERRIRFAIACVLFAWVVLDGNVSLGNGILLVCAVFLTLNAATARCYLWRWLGIKGDDEACSR